MHIRFCPSPTHPDVLLPIPGFTGLFIFLQLQSIEHPSEHVLNQIKKTTCLFDLRRLQEWKRMVRVCTTIQCTGGRGLVEAGGE